MFEVKFLSSLEKVFPNEKLTGTDFSAQAFENEKLNFQIACFTDNTDVMVYYFIELVGKTAKYFRLYSVQNVPSDLPCNHDADDYVLSKKAGIYPDLLKEINEQSYLTVSPFQWTSFWVESRGNIPVGKHTLTIRIRDSYGNCTAEKEIFFEILRGVLPEIDIPVTQWIYPNCISSLHGVEVYSDAFYKVFENYLKTYVEYGNTMIFLSVFTPPLNIIQPYKLPNCQLVDIRLQSGKYVFCFEKLLKYMRFCRAYGIKYFEINHLFSQWGALYAPSIYVETKKGTEDIFGWDVSSTDKKYEEFLSVFLDELIDFLEKNGFLSETYFHMSDEPKIRDKELYARLSAIVKPHLKGRPVIDALSDYEFFENAGVDIPVVQINRTEKFVENNKDLWVYYCWEHCNNYVSNRFFGMPSQRNRILGYQLYANGVKGFLHWGYNFFYSAFGQKTLNPLFETDCEKKFPSGDAFLVYPNVKNCSVYKSVRLLTFHEGLQDYRALLALEKKYSKDFVRRFLEENGIKGFYEYPRSADAHLRIRKEINRLLTEGIEE